MGWNDWILPVAAIAAGTLLAGPAGGAAAASATGAGAAGAAGAATTGGLLAGAGAAGAGAGAGAGLLGAAGTGAAADAALMTSAGMGAEAGAGMAGGSGLLGPSGMGMAQGSGILGGESMATAGTSGMAGQGITGAANAAYGPAMYTTEPVVPAWQTYAGKVGKAAQTYSAVNGAAGGQQQQAAPQMQSRPIFSGESPPIAQQQHAPQENQFARMLLEKRMRGGMMG